MALARSRLTIDGGRVLLRPVRDEDLNALVREASDPEIARYTRVPYPYTREHAANFLAYAQEQLRLKQEYHLAIVSKETGELIGMMGLRDIDEESHRAEVGYWVGRAHWGEGIASEALALAIELAFDRLDLRRLYAFVLEGNLASVRMLERMGFNEEGRLRWHTRRDGKWMDKVWFGLLREEWEARREGTRE